MLHFVQHDIKNENGNALDIDSLFFLKIWNLPSLKDSSTYTKKIFGRSLDKYR